MRLYNYINESKDWNEYMRTNKMLSNAVDVLKKIENLGRYDAYLVGGCVRDIVLGIDPKDIDIATNCPIEVIDSRFKTHDIGKSKDFGIVVVNYGGYSYEVAQFRSDGKYFDNRRPEKIEIVGSFKDDVSRRDFTVNSMGIDKDGNIIDYFDGKKDIKNKVLKTVGNPYKRFGEDALRMMRAARFSSRFNLDIDTETGKAIKNLSDKITNLSNERIRDELVKAASESGDKFARYIEILDRYKLLRYILPEVQNLKYFKQSLKHHPEGRTGDTLSGTVWVHTIEALKQIGAKQPIAMIATLLHDIGKGVTFDMSNGKLTYYRHAEEGVKLVNDIADRLRFSNKEKESLMFAVANHMKFHDLLNMKPSKISKLVNDDNFDVLVSVAKADEFCRGERFMYKGEFDKIIDKAIEIKDKWGKRQLNVVSNIVSGYTIMRLLNIKQGKLVGKIKKEVMEYLIDNNIKSESEIEDVIRIVGRKYT